MDCQQLHPYMSKDIRLIDIVHKLKKLQFCIKPTPGSVYVSEANIIGKAQLTQTLLFSNYKLLTWQNIRWRCPEAFFSQVTLSDFVLVQRNLVMRNKQLSKESKEYFSQCCLCEPSDVRRTLIFGLPRVPWVKSNEHCFQHFSKQSDRTFKTGSLGGFFRLYFQYNVSDVVMKRTSTKQSLFGSAVKMQSTYCQN